jgi:hypothetical protein
MGIDFSCPINGEKRDNTTVRVVAGLVFTISVAAFLTALLSSVKAAAIITGLLALDFIIRAFIKPKYSPLATLARGIVSGLNLPKKMVDSAPKVFAARVGVAFSVSATILFLLGAVTAGAIVLGILILCAALEAFLGFCLGCWMYALFPQNIANWLSR